MVSVKRCVVCVNPVNSSMIFCSERCQRIGRLIRNAQAGLDEPAELALPPELQVTDENPMSAQLQKASVTHRDRVAVIMAAYTRSEIELDAIIWAAYAHGFTLREIGDVLEMRTSSVRRRVLAFRSRLHGPAPVSTAV